MHLVFDLLDFLFPAINCGNVKDTDIDIIMDSIVDSLFSVFVNLGEFSTYASNKIMEIFIDMS